MGLIEAEADAFDPSDGVDVKNFELWKDCYATSSRNQYVLRTLAKGKEQTSVFTTTREGKDLIHMAAHKADKTLDSYRIQYAADGVWLIAVHKPSGREEISWFLRRKT